MAIGAARLMLSLAVAVSVAGCQHQVTSVADLSSIPSCTASSFAPVTWTPSPHDNRLDRWCAQVGSPVVAIAPAVSTGRLTEILIVSWNMHVGGGQVIDFVESLRRSAATRTGAAVGFVLLLQEAYRAGGDIPPPTPGGGVPGSIRPRPRSLDIVALAHSLGMSLAYVPSMRNGAGHGADDDDVGRDAASHVGGDGPEDRGNAVLSTEPLSDLEAIELPFGRQRRVAVTAVVTPRGGFSPLRVVAAHFDTVRTRGQRGQAEHLARALERFRGETPALPLVVGIDTNDIGGADGATVAAIARVAPLVSACGHRRTSGLFRLDFMFSTLAAAETKDCRTLGESFGSDHRPVVLTLSAGEPVD